MTRNLSRSILAAAVIGVLTPALAQTVPAAPTAAKPLCSTLKSSTPKSPGINCIADGPIDQSVTSGVTTNQGSADLNASTTLNPSTTPSASTDASASSSMSAGTSSTPAPASGKATKQPTTTSGSSTTR